MITLSPTRPNRVEQSKSWVPPRVPKQANSGYSFELGGAVHFVFRGRTYRVNPLPWKEGQRLSDLYDRIQRASEEVAEGSKEEYRAALEQLPRFIWRNVQSSSPILRILRRVGVVRNPFKTASEGELISLLYFLSSCRMRSSVQLRPSQAANRSM